MGADQSFIPGSNEKAVFKNLIRTQLLLVSLRARAFRTTFPPTPARNNSVPRLRNDKTAPFTPAIRYFRLWTAGAWQLIPFQTRPLQLEPNSMTLCQDCALAQESALDWAIARCYGQLSLAAAQLVMSQIYKLDCVGLKVSVDALRQNNPDNPPTGNWIIGPAHSSAGLSTFCAARPVQNSSSVSATSGDHPELRRLAKRESAAF